MKKNNCENLFKYFICNLLKTFLIFFMLTSCGTDTGNPSVTSSNPPQNLISGPFTTQLANIMCQRLTQCFSPAPTNCNSQIMSESHISSSLSLNENTYKNLNEIQTAIDSKVLSVNTEKINTCMNSIYNLNCQSTTIQSAYNNSDVENISEIWRLLQVSTSCQQIFN